LNQFLIEQLIVQKVSSLVNIRGGSMHCHIHIGYAVSIIFLSASVVLFYLIVLTEKEMFVYSYRLMAVLILIPIHVCVVHSVIHVEVSQLYVNENQM